MQRHDGDHEQVNCQESRGNGLIPVNKKQDSRDNQAKDTRGENQCK